MLSKIDEKNKLLSHLDLFQNLNYTYFSPSKVSKWSIINEKINPTETNAKL